MVIQLVSSLMTKDMIDDFIEILDLADIYVYIYIYFFSFWEGGGNYGSK